MIEKQFTYDKNGWGGVWSDIICWVNFSCPSCNKYRSTSFVFTLEPDKTEYMGRCFHCGEEMRILIPVEVNNKLYELQTKQREELDDKCERRGSKSLDKWLEAV